MKRKYFISVLGLIIGITFIINYPALLAQEPCEGPMESQEFEECSGCEAIMEDISCSGNGGFVYNFAKPIESEGLE